MAAVLLLLSLPPSPKPGNPKILSFSFLLSDWLLASLFTNQNQLGASSQKLHVDLVQTVFGKHTQEITMSFNKFFCMKGMQWPSTFC